MASTARLRSSLLGYRVTEAKRSSYMSTSTRALDGPSIILLMFSLAKASASRSPRPQTDWSSRIAAGKAEREGEIGVVRMDGRLLHSPIRTEESKGAWVRELGSMTTNRKGRTCIDSSSAGRAGIFYCSSWRTFCWPPVPPPSGSEDTLHADEEKMNRDQGRGSRMSDSNGKKRGMQRKTKRDGEKLLGGGWLSLCLSRPLFPSHSLDKDKFVPSVLLDEVSDTGCSGNHLAPLTLSHPSFAAVATEPRRREWEGDGDGREELVMERGSHVVKNTVPGEANGCDLKVALYLTQRLSNAARQVRLRYAAPFCPPARSAAVRLVSTHTRPAEKEDGKGKEGMLEGGGDRRKGQKGCGGGKC
ncbi:hypothetical protein EYF80_008187 [Liparis tanakae]|uniref:Uncharacterized protein n=1 Tax=Liparis tanakae TaxID=230148 RepID=A0A4Z2IV88_9TELE|nr:hypothetical protein EYF80_008187 [Liparis tanakae]